ncbi:response regulator [Pontibacterium granulatum]|uniref:response regulator n=1 Tax=Pontibacterium granulatum TaxID=2036029 RepID=UPI00249A08E1|nr:response regulator [Pontibacterium granulatum]MDI3322927.1 response regulator [Pontibacterium granulatum]
MATVDYSDKRVLLVESSGNMRASIFYMLRSVGISNIRATTVSNRVLAEIAEHSYDIILLGHNVSDSFAGIQLLEEARYRGYMKPSACWVFMTSDASQEAVLHAIESKPDILITKPFTIDKLKGRLDALMIRRQRFMDIDRALESGDEEAALRLCLTRFTSSDPDFDEAQLIACQILSQIMRYEELQQLSEELYWRTRGKEAGLYWAESLMYQGMEAESISLLQDVIAANPLYLAAYDLLARAHEYQGDLDEAREIVKLATSKSPMGIPRQMELGRLATQTSKLDVAQGAYKRSITLGQKSCYKSAEPYLKLANVLRLNVDPDSENQVLDTERQFDALLAQASSQFKEDETLKVKSALLRAELARTLDREDEIDKYTQEAKRENSQLGNPLDLGKEIARFSGEVISKPALSASATSKGEVKAKTKRDPEMSMKVNRQGVRHYANGRLSQALRHFGLALEYDHMNGSALCNLAQLYLELARDDKPKRDARLIMFDRNMHLAGKIRLAGEVRQKCEQLMALRQKDIDELPDGPLGVLLR